MRNANAKKWFCVQACGRDATPTVRVPDTVYPPPECPYQGADHPYGLIRNIAERFADGSLRLTRDVPFGSERWKQLYHRARNAVEGRNAFFERAGLKRLPVYGEARSRALSGLANVWLNLTTLARLFREATAATGG